MAATAAIATIGHNSGEKPKPPPTPFELSRDEIDGLFAEAKNWADGSVIASQDQADAVGRLLDMIGEAIRTADTRRKVEARPHDEAKAEIQARYNKLIGDTKGSGKGKAILAREACQAALTPWRVKQEQERQAAAEAARRAAEEAQREAAFAFDITRSDDLDGRQKAEELAAEAKAAEAAAKRAGKPTATGLRTVTRAEVTDYRAFLNWIAANRADALRGMLDTYADTLCAQNVRGVPGLAFHAERIAR